MESLTSIKSVDKEIKISESVGRIKIGKVESEKLMAMVEQAQCASKGFLALSKSDVVNFLIREQKPELSSKQMQQLRVQFYDPIRHMNWITQALKEALATGDMVAVSSLQDEIKGIELSVAFPGKLFSSESASVPTAGPFERKPRKKRKRSWMNRRLMI